MHHHRALVVALTSVVAIGACTRGGFAPPSPDRTSDSARDVEHALDGSRPDGPGLDGSRLDAPRPDGPLPDRALLDQPLAESGAPVACSWTGSFSLSPPSNLTSLNSPVEDGNPYLTPDGKTLYFESKRPGGTGVEDIWTTTRPTVGGSWAAPVNYASLNTSLSDSAFALTADGLTGFLSSNRAGGTGGMDVWIVSRASTAVLFASAAALPVSAVNDALHQFDPMPTANGLRLYLSSADFPASLGGLGGAEIVFSTRTGSGPAYGKPVPVPGVNSSSSEANPTLTEDEAVILFASNRAGGSGGTDLWYATRSTASPVFATPKPVPTLNSSDYDGEPFVTPDGCEVYFVSSRPGGLGGWDLYRSSYLKHP